MIAEQTAPSITNREFELFRHLIREKTGIDLRDTKRALLVSRLARRLRELGVDSFLGYYQLLASGRSPGELSVMINCITTNKTSFFREAAHFEYLAGHLRGRARKPGRRAPYRIWSAACSTGEEPYTIAITALEAMGACAAEEVEILATDIDTEVLRKAGAAIYPEPRIGEMASALRSKYFLQGTGEWEGMSRVKPKVAGMVRFERLNLVEPSWPLDVRFDAIFCRNVIIYFNQETQRTLFQRLLEKLVPDGLLFIGHAETLQWVSNDVTPLQHAIYRRRCSPETV